MIAQVRKISWQMKTNNKSRSRHNKSLKKNTIILHKIDSKKLSSIMTESQIDTVKARYPFCIVWTPIPVLTWMFPFIGHMGIAMSSGVIRDFAGPYFVSEDNMGFGKPTKYWQLNPQLVRGAAESWDRAISDASEEYKTRMHNLCCDNCHSHVAMALNLMSYDDSKQWNMVKLCFLMLIHGKHISFAAWLKTWLPFLLMLAGIITVVVLTRPQ